MALGKSRTPVEPMRTTAQTTLIAVAAVVIAAAITALFGLNNAFGIGQSHSTCTVAPSGLLKFNGSGANLGGLTSGVTTFAESFNVCDQRPGTMQKFLVGASQAPTFLLLIGIAYLVVRLTRSVARDGIYTTRCAAQIRWLAWALLIGGLAASAVEAGARESLLASMTDYSLGASAFFQFWSFPWTFLFVTMGLLTFARFLRVGVRIREENDGTI